MTNLPSFPRNNLDLEIAVAASKFLLLVYISSINLPKEKRLSTNQIRGERGKGYREGLTGELLLAAEDLEPQVRAN